MKNQVIPGQINNLLIMGPAMIPGNGVLEAIYALYYLPMNYTLMFPVSAPEDKVFRDKVMSMVKKDSLGARVHFGKETTVPREGRSTTINLSEAIAKATSPEAAASAILRCTRANALAV